MSHLGDEVPTQHATVDVEEVHTVYARDLFGNLQIHQDDVFAVTLTHKADPATVVNGVVTAQEDGIYEITYTLSKSGEYMLDVTLQPGGTGPSYLIKNAPFNVICSVTTVDASNTVLSGTGVTDTIAGEVATFTVTLFDSGNNQREMGGDTLLVTITGITDIETFDNNDGTYQVDYKILDASTTYDLSVIVNGDSGNEKTSTITVVPNLPHASSSTLTYTTPVDLDVDSTVDIQIFDAFNNPVLIEQPVV